ncbi:MAG: hypothetical protein K0R52_1478 [Alphaproteobacteria bacterium]|jgi:hypothetical protein|nr:hypothetical protein [Alphaproteobacteria bacterium]
MTVKEMAGEGCDNPSYELVWRYVMNNILK